MIRNRQIRRGQDTPDIDVTAFLNLMVVLIPFLLLSAAFNHLTMFQLYLPAADSQAEVAPDELPSLALELRESGLRLQVDGRTQAELPHLADGQPDTGALQTALRPLKNRYPTLTQISILSEPAIAYARIVTVMDAVRAMRIEEDGPAYRLELFPDIGLGAAPERG